MSQSSFVRALTAVVAACAVTGGGWALGQSLQTLPPANDLVAGGSNNLIPLGATSGGRFLTLYSVNQLTGIPVGSLITGLQLRQRNAEILPWPNSATNISDYEIWLAQSTRTPATLSTTFADNLVNPQRVRDGALALALNAYPGGAASGSTPEGWGPLIVFQNVYVYQGGALVLEFRSSGGGLPVQYADCAVSDASLAGLGSIVSPTNVTGSTTGGLIVRLTFTPPTVDLAKGVTKVIVGEKYAGAMAGTGEGVLIWSLPYTQQAVAAANQFDTIGPGTDFVGVSWRQWTDGGSAWPGAVANFGDYNVQLSRSQNPPSSLSTTIASNVGPDAVTVRSGALSLPIGNFGPRGAEVTSPFAPEVGFSNPYQYRSGPLLAVTRQSGQGTGTVSYLDAISTFDAETGVTVKAFQVNNAAAATTNQGSAFTIARYSVDAGTSSPLNQLAPGADAFGIEVVPVLQTVLSASELKYIPVGSVIDSLWLRQIASAGAGPATNVTATDFELTVSTATIEPSGMSQNFAANEGADKVLVHDGGLFVAANTMPAGSNGNFGKIVQFQRNFVYKGGPLCITIRHTGLSAPIGIPEALFGTGATNRTTYSFTPGAAAGSFYLSSYTGTAMKLGYIPSVMTPNNRATQSGASGPAWFLPQNATATVQVIIAADQLRSVDVGSAITGMSLRNVGASTFPAVNTNLTRFDVTMAPAANAPLSMSSTFANNNGPGVVTVRSGAMSVPAGAYPQAASGASENAWYVPFSRAYVYTGGDLCVTIRSEGILSSTGLFDGDGASPSARGASRFNYFTGGANATTGNPWGLIAIRFAFTARAFCPWDLNNDGVVSDDDFPIFLGAYNTLDCTDAGMPEGCPADFNFDRVVNDTDFELFIGAYNDLLCP